MLNDTYVTSDSGTGVVHQAPAFGEDDLRIGLANGVVKEGDLPCPIDATGKFLDVVSHYAGMYIKVMKKLVKVSF